MLRFASIAAIALMAAACTPPADEAARDEASTAEPSTVAATAPATPGAAGMPQMQASLNAPDAEALHALLLANEADIVPSDWHTGEPAGQQFWDFPDTMDGFDASAECSWEGNDQSAMDCLLTISEPEDAEGGPRRVMYRAEVGYTPEGELTLLSPNVRWATMG
ncbi:MAG: hypothetical protein GC208_06310 [Alphaproteobacteria bacterium]|nr:hypothetical protein [Alphaproteobacteria bacterium]